jgi:hypothetical protein
MSQPQHPIDRYITWAQWMPKDAQRPRRWVEDVGWDKVSGTMAAGGEEALTRSYKAWRAAPDEG